MRNILLTLLCLAVVAGCSGAGGGTAGGVSGGSGIEGGGVEEGDMEEGGTEQGGTEEGDTEEGESVDIIAAPVANAGEDQIVLVNSLVLMDGGNSQHAVEYQWALVKKPHGSIATLDDEDMPDPSFIPDRSGWYTVQLVVAEGVLTSEPDHAMVLAVLDDFDRDDLQLLSASPEWLAIEELPGGPDVGVFQIRDKIAFPTSNGVNVNLWSESYAQDQEAFFTVKHKPADANTSSLGVFLRSDDDAQTGYLVTFVPQPGLNDDNIRVWKVVEGVAVWPNICQLTYEFYTDDQIWVRAVDNAISVFVDQYAIIDYSNPIGTCNDEDAPYLRGGYVGIYAAKDSGALDNFGGGSIGP